MQSVTETRHQWKKRKGKR